MEIRISEWTESDVKNALELGVKLSFELTPIGNGKVWMTANVNEHDLRNIVTARGDRKEYSYDAAFRFIENTTGLSVVNVRMDIA